MANPTLTWPESAGEVKVLAQLERDARLICDLLQKAGIGCDVCPNDDPPALAAALAGHCLILSEELLTPQLVELLQAVLRDQPTWSDFPVVLLTQGGEVSVSTQKKRELRGPLGNVVLLERPVRPETLISTVQNALRARARQYQIREQIEQYRQAEEALRKAEKLAVAGRLASSIAHEINNPLESVTNLLYLMHSCETIDQVRGYLQTAEAELARVSEIATHTLQFYRQSSRPARVLVTEVLESALALYRPRLNAVGIRIEKKFGAVAPIVGMSGELRQVFSNLIGNSLDAMRSGGRLLVRAHNSRDYQNDLNSGVRIVIADTGSGVPKELREKIFEPFVTTKGATGTGLGLWISSEIVQKHGGYISLKTRDGSDSPTGTVFSIFLPLQNNHGLPLQDGLPPQEDRPLPAI